MNEDLLDALGRSLREDLDSEVAGGEHDDPWLAPFADHEQDLILDGALGRIEAKESLEPLASLEALDEVPDEIPEAVARDGPPAVEEAKSERAGGAKVIDLRSRRLGIGIGSVLAAAAAVVFMVFQLGGPGPSGDLVATLPSYSTSQLQGGLAAQRGADDEPKPDALELGPDGRIDWVLTPAEPVRETLAAALLATPEAGGEAIYAPEVSAQISPAGAVRLRGKLSEFIALGPGSWSLTMLIAPAGALPTEVGAAQEAGDWQRATIRVTISVAP